MGVKFRHPVNGATTASTLGTPAKLRRFNVTIRRFDPSKGLAGGADFVLPVDRIDQEHAISSTLANAVSWTIKCQRGAVLPVAFRCTGIKEGR